MSAAYRIDFADPTSSRCDCGGGQAQPIGGPDCAVDPHQIPGLEHRRRLSGGAGVERLLRFHGPEGARGPAPCPRASSAGPVPYSGTGFG